MSSQYNPPQVILDLSLADPNLVPLLADIARGHEKGQSGIYLMQSANALGMSTKFVAFLAKFGKVVSLNTDQLVVCNLYNYMSTSFLDGKMKPWVAMMMKEGGLGSQRDIRGDLSKAAVVYMTVRMVYPTAAIRHFERVLDGATTLVFDDAHLTSQEAKDLIYQIPYIIRRMSRPLQVILMSSTLDSGFERAMWHNCKKYVFKGFTSF